MFFYYAYLYLKKNNIINKELLIKYLKTNFFRRGTKLYSKKYYKELLKDENYSINDILNGHKSYIERNIDENYYIDLKDFIKRSSYIIDIGCGLNPLLFLKDNEYNNSYFAIDRDKFILEVLCESIQNFNLPKVIPFIMNINNPNAEARTIFKSHSGLVFVQKIIPPLSYSHNRKALTIISEIQCKYFLLTGSVNSLSRNVCIYEKEKTSIEAFIKRYGFTKISCFNKVNEFGWIVTKNTGRRKTDV
jgi:hypothetical protein